MLKTITAASYCGAVVLLTLDFTRGIFVHIIKESGIL